MRKFEYDFFVSHASEDKARLARPLVKCLKQEGFTVWFDEQQIKTGHSLARSIEQGLLKSRYALLLATTNFFDPKKYWTHSERDALMALEAASTNRILPILHALPFPKFQRFAPLLAGRLVSNTDNGLGEVVRSLSALFPAKPLSRDASDASRTLHPFWRGQAIVGSRPKRTIEVAAELLRYGDSVFAHWHARSVVDGKKSSDTYQVSGELTNNEFVALYGEHSDNKALNKGYILMRISRTGQKMTGKFIAVSRNNEGIVGGSIQLEKVKSCDD